MATKSVSIKRPSRRVWIVISLGLFALFSIPTAYLLWGFHHWQHLDTRQLQRQDHPAFLLSPRSDGSYDFPQAVASIYGDGCTSENNIVITLLEIEPGATRDTVDQQLQSMFEFEFDPARQLPNLDEQAAVDAVRSVSSDAFEFLNQDPSERAQVQQWIARHDASLSYLLANLKVRDRYFCPIPPNQTSPFAVTLHHAADAREVVELLAIGSLVAMDQQQTAKAADAIVGTFRLADRIGQGPTLFEQYVAKEIYVNAIRLTALWLSQRGPDDSESLQAILSAERNVRWTDNLTRCLDNHVRITAMTLIDYAISQDISQEFAMTGTSCPLHGPGFTHPQWVADQTNQMIDQLLKILQQDNTTAPMKPLKDWQQYWEGQYHTTTDWNTFLRSPSRYSDGFLMWQSHLVCDAQGLMAQKWTYQTQRRMLDMAVALDQWQQDHDQLPEDATRLRLESVLDPITGLPITWTWSDPAQNRLRIQTTNVDAAVFEKAADEPYWIEITLPKLKPATMDTDGNLEKPPSQQ